MKKMFMFAIIVIALFATSCNKSVKETEVSTDSTTIVVVVDSLVVDSVSIDTVVAK